MKVIFINAEGGVSVIHPTPEALNQYGIEAIAIKDVPTGHPFKIVEDSEVPSRCDRAAWKVDPASLTDGVGGESDVFPEEAP